MEHRPNVVQSRNKSEDYKIDLIVEAKNHATILTGIDRISRECIIKSYRINLL